MGGVRMVPMANINGPIKSLMDTTLVIPAKAGIQSFRKAIDSDFYPPLRISRSDGL